MRKYMRTLLLALTFFIGTACQPAAEPPPQNTVTLLFTNDVESAYDPIPAFWVEDQEMITSSEYRSHGYTQKTETF